MRVLQPLFDGGGGTPPQLAVTRLLVERGHEVCVIGHRTLRDRVESRGAQLVEFRDTYPDFDTSRPETDHVADWAARTSFGSATRFRDRAIRAMTPGTARETVALLEQWPADVMLADFLMFGAGVAADVAGIPCFSVVHCPYPSPHTGAPPIGTGLRPGRNALARGRDRVLNTISERFYGPAVETVNEVRAEYGLPPFANLPEALMDIDGTFVVSAPEFDFSSRGCPPGNVSFVGPAFEVPDGEWTPPWPEDNRDPLVIASFSTTYMNHRPLAERVLEALAPLPVRALVTTGPALDLTGASVPANARVLPFVPHVLAAPHASLFITHAGLGTTHAALRAGLPVVCIPDCRDQPDVAARVVEAGAGIRLPKKASAARIRKAVERGLSDPSLKAGAMRIAEALNRRDGAAAIVDELEARVGAMPERERVTT
jgi:MGT family glycosyltransferase